MKRSFFASILALSAILLAGCGPIDVPDGATDLRAGLSPLAADFDARRGRDRLLLLLSPA